MSAPTRYLAVWRLPDEPTPIQKVVAQHVTEGEVWELHSIAGSVRMECDLADADGLFAGVVRFNPYFPTIVIGSLDKVNERGLV